MRRFLLITLLSLFVGSTLSAAPSKFDELKLLQRRALSATEAVGNMTIAGVKREVLQAKVRPEIAGNLEVGLYSVALPFASIGDLVEKMRQGPADIFDVESGLLIVASKDVSVASQDLPAKTRKLWSEVMGTTAFSLDLTMGLNLLSRVRLDPMAAPTKGLNLLGVRHGSLVLQGSILNDFDFNALKEAKKEKRLGDELIKGLALTAHLPAFSLKGLPDTFTTGQVSLTVTGKPGVGLGFALNMIDGEHERAITCNVGFEKAELGTNVEVVGRAVGLWPKLFGLKGFDVEDATIKLGFEVGKSVSFGLGGQLTLGTKKIGLAGQIKVHPISGAPVGGFFAGSLNSIGASDLTSFCNKVASVDGKPRKLASSDDLVDFNLENVYLKIAPFESDADLGVYQGFAIKGKLSALGRQIAYVDGRIDTGGILPYVDLKGSITDFDFGVVSLKDAKVDVKLGLITNPHFRLKGSAQLLGGSRTIDVRLSRKEIYFDTIDRLAGVFKVHMHVSSPSKGKPTWNLAADFDNELSRTLEKKTSKDLVAWANRTKAKFDKAVANLERAKNEVKRLDGLIKKERAEARKKIDKKIAKIKKAQADVRKLDGVITKVRAEINAKRKAKYNKFASRRKSLKSAYDAWQSAIRARKRAKGIAKIKAKAKEATKFTAYKTANAAYKISKAAYDAVTKIPVDADPRIVAAASAKVAATGVLKANQAVVQGLNNIHVLENLDPDVAKLLAARTAALAGLNVAQGAVKATSFVVTGAARVGAWAAKNNGQVAMIDGGHFAAQLAGYLRGNRLNVGMDVRFLGKAHKIRLNISPADMKPDKVVALLVEKLKKLA